MEPVTPSAAEGRRHDFDLCLCSNLHLDTQKFRKNSIEMSSATVKEAQRLRNLGLYPQAEAKFRQAIDTEDRSPEDDALLRVEFAAMLMEQGIVKDCRHELLKIREHGLDMPPLGEMSSAVQPSTILWPIPRTWPQRGPCTRPT
jgi:hypothetical protein